MTTALTKTLNKRKGRKIIINKVIDEINTIMENGVNEENNIKLKVLNDTITEKYLEVKNLDNIIEDLLVDDEEKMLEDTEDAYEFEKCVRTIKERMDKYLKLSSNGSEDINTNRTRTNANRQVKLPTIIIKPYEGDPLEWKTFYQSFLVTIDKNEDLSNIEKFTYLRSYLKGNALKVIEGLPLDESNYNEAKNLLINRFANPQLIISAHMNKLLKIEKVNTTNVNDLRKLYDGIEGNVRALGSYGIELSSFGPLLIPVALEKLPNGIQLQVSRKLGNETWDVNKFLSVINDEITARENFEFLKSDRNKEEQVNRRGTASTLVAHQKRKQCVFCSSEEHYSDRCDVITDIYQRRQKLKDDNRCFRCLRQGHNSRACRSKIYCYSCKAQNNHNTALCMIDKNESNTTVVASEESESLKGESNTNIAGIDESVLLQTANGYVADIKEERMTKAKILLDSCSQQTFIVEDVVKKLNCKPLRKVNMCVKSFGSKIGKDMTLNEYQLVIKPNDCKTSMYIKALAIPNICAVINGQNINKALEKHSDLKELCLADDGSRKNENVDILIGADAYWNIVDGKLIKNETGLTAISSKLGWLLNGPINNDDENVQGFNKKSGHTLFVETNYDEDKLLSNEIKKFWSLDMIGISEEENSVYDRFKDTIKFDNNRYEVELPLKESYENIKDNYYLCKKRLENIKNKLDLNSDLKKSYDDVFQEQLVAGVIEKVDTDNEDPKLLTYLPHREVIREDKQSTKVRVVFDASAKSPGSVSLNDVLYKGPCLNSDLFRLLIKFRSYRFGLVADIEKAYLQINVAEKHRDLLRFLYYDDIYKPEPNIIPFRFKRVIFGATCSQFLLNGTIHKHAEKYQNIDPDFCKKIKEDFYVDDLTSGFNDTKDGFDLYTKMKVRFGEANFNVRKWRSNDNELMDLIHDDDRNKENEEKVLGITWNNKTDKLILSVQQIFEEASTIVPTKRNILKIIASVYDPIGYLAPIVIKLKLIFQEICRENIGWDDHIGTLLEKWLVIVNLLRNMQDVELDRCYFVYSFNDPIDKYTLHGFSDASNLAYGAVIYIKTIHRSGIINVSFVINNDLWWKGAPFLLKDESRIRDEKTGDHDYAEQDEEEIASLIVETTPTDSETKSVIKLKRYSSINKAYRVTAYLFRFIHNIRNKEKRKGF